MGLTFSTSLDIEETANLVQLLETFSYSYALRNPNTKAYSILDKTEFDKIALLFGTLPKSIILHEKNDDQDAIIDTPLGIHIMKLSFYSLFLLSTHDQNLLKLMKEQETKSK